MTGPPASRRAAALPSTAVLVVVAVAVAFVGAALSQAWTDGPTVDEGTYLSSGVAALARHDLRVNRQTAPLAKVLAALPVLANGPSVPRGALWRRADERAITRSWVRRELAAGRLHLDVFLGRLVPIAVAVAAAWVILRLGDLLFGTPAGAFGAVLWLANPFVLGLGHLDGIDVAASLTTLLVTLALLVYLRDPSRRALVVVGIASGAAVLTRATGLLVLAAVAASLVAVHWRSGVRPALRRGAVVLGTAWATVAAAYLVLSPVDVAPAAGEFAPLAVLRRLALPPAWLHGLGYLARIGSRPGPAFLLGHAHVGRWPMFWVLAPWVKLPLFTVLVMVTAPLAWRRLDTPARRQAAWVLGPSALVLTLFTVQQQRPIGLRYLLPVIALGMVAASPWVVVTPQRARRALWVGVAGTAVVSCLFLPSLSWTLPLFGRGYDVAADSNLDWGQAWPALEAFSATHHPWVDYFGVAGLEEAQLPGARDLATAPTDLRGWVAVSASDLTVYRRDRLRWLRAYCPVAVLDRVILVYRFRDPPDRSLVGPDAPPAPCRGWSRRTA